MKLLYYINRLLRISALEKKLLLKGFLLCLFLMPVIKLIPLKYYLNLLKIKTRLPVNGEERISTILLVRRTMRRIGRFSPVSFSCMVKSAAFKIILNEMGMESTLSLGVRFSDSRILAAHAFVKVDEKAVFLGRTKFREVDRIE